MIRFLLTFLIFISAEGLAAAEDTCGLFLRESFDHGDEIFTITSFAETTGEQFRYRITNPDHTGVQNMLRGFCYCLSGPVMPDPAFSGDLSYMLLTVEAVRYGPYKSCSPFAGK